MQRALHENFIGNLILLIIKFYLNNIYPNIFIRKQ